MALVFQELSESAFLLETGALVTEMKAAQRPEDDYGVEMPINIPGADVAVKIQSWGRKNDLPQQREAILSANNIVPQLLATKRDITVGGGLFTFKYVYKDGKRSIEEVPMPEQTSEFLEKIDVMYYLMNASKNFFFHSNVFTEFITTMDGQSIASIRSLESRHVRVGAMQENGKIPAYYWSGHWVTKKGSKKVNDIKTIKSYDNMFDGDEFPRGKFLYHTGDDLLGDDYYYSPAWYGGKTWIELANVIPHFHKANIRNGYVIRYHIEYPKDLFDDNTLPRTNEAEKKAADDARLNAKTEFLTAMNNWLAGIENAGRAMYTSYELNRAAGKEFPGVKITPISVDLKDEALLKLFESSNQANISAQGVHPTLANIETQGKLSSGSEIRNAFLMYLAIKTPVPRRILLEPINLVKKINKWDPEIHLGFRDMEITRLDDDKSGKAEATAQ
jgi:hypothetical protein